MCKRFTAYWTRVDAEGGLLPCPPTTNTTTTTSNNGGTKATSLLPSPSHREGSLASPLRLEVRRAVQGWWGDDTTAAHPWQPTNHPLPLSLQEKKTITQTIFGTFCLSSHC